MDKWPYDHATILKNFITPHLTPNKCYKFRQISTKSAFLCYNFNDFKKELIQMNEEKGFNKTVINWLITIYTRIDENLGKIRDCEI